jgi:hypothetical protein
MDTLRHHTQLEPYEISMDSVCELITRCGRLAISTTAEAMQAHDAVDYQLMLTLTEVSVDG